MLALFSMSGHNDAGLNGADRQDVAFRRHLASGVNAARVVFEAE